MAAGRLPLQHHLPRSVALHALVGQRRAGMVLCNTARSTPDGVKAPAMVEGPTVRACSDRGSLSSYGLKSGDTPNQRQLSRRRCSHPSGVYFAGFH